jgi:hypothetical protein
MRTFESLVAAAVSSYVVRAWITVPVPWCFLLCVGVSGTHRRPTDRPTGGQSTDT